MKKIILLFLLSAGSFLHAAPELSPLDPGRAWRKKQPRSKAKVENFMPEIRGNTIFCGNKTLLLSPDGSISLAADGKPFAEMVCYFSLKSSKLKRSFRVAANRNICREQSRFERNGNTFYWDIATHVPNSGLKAWSAVQQTLEVLPDGKIRISAFMKPPADNSFKMRSFMHFVMPWHSGDNTVAFSFNGARSQLTPDLEKVKRKTGSRDLVYKFYLDDAGKCFELSAVRKKDASDMPCLVIPATRRYRINVEPVRKDNGFFCSVTLDLRHSPAMKKNTFPGGIDFREIEDLELPEYGKNLLVNPSFEQGMLGVHYGLNPRVLQRGGLTGDHYALDESTAFHGKTSLRLLAPVWQKGNDMRMLDNHAILSLMSPVVSPGVYTFSVYARSDMSQPAVLNFWSVQFKASPYTMQFKRSCRLTGSWQRYSMTFEIKESMPLMFRFTAGNTGKAPCRVWVDAFQLERGKKASAYTVPPVMGRLLTARNDNFLPYPGKLDARMRISTSPYGSGVMDCRVKNFFGEVLYRGTLGYKADRNGYCEVPLPLEDLPGPGIYMLRTEYRTQDGRRCVDHHRYTRINFLDNRHKHKNLFSEVYGYAEGSRNYAKLLDRWRKVGIGSKPHCSYRDPAVYELMAKYRVDPVCAVAIRWYYKAKNGPQKGFAIADHEVGNKSLTPESPGVLVCDFHRDSNGTVTAEYLDKLTAAAARLASRRPEITNWFCGAETGAHMPYDWWKQNGNMEDFAEIYAKILAAYAKGIRQGNPRAKVFPECPNNMNPVSGIAEIDRLLKHCQKYNVRFDGFGWHPYRFSPEAPDLDADTARMLKMLEKYGYDKEPVLWPEMMHWGPFNIPQWGIESSCWTNRNRYWRDFVISYDMGRTEKLSAAWRVRSWLVALKYGDRVKNANSGAGPNNAFLDVDLTPYASHLAPNVLGNLLGNADFRSDIRFAPYIRCFVFEDEARRPVAAVWCHLPDVDNGVCDAPQVETGFGDMLEGVFDMMNAPRRFTKGKFRYPVTSFPVFLRGKPGTLKSFTEALRNTVLISGSGIAPVSFDCRPGRGDFLYVTLKNFVSTAFEGDLNGCDVTVPANGTAVVKLPFDKTSEYKGLAKRRMKLVLRKNNSSSCYTHDVDFETFSVKRLADGISLDNVDWKNVPSFVLDRQCKSSPGKTSAEIRTAYNSDSFFLRLKITDSKFCHVEYRIPSTRWANDCVQFFIDTMCNAAVRKGSGMDEDDYSYALFPDSAGKSARLFRYRTVEAQLGLATRAPEDETFADDVPVKFERTSDGYIYSVMIPAKYLLPLQLASGNAFGCGFFIPNSDEKGRYTSAITCAADGGTCEKRPETWPVAVFE